MAKAELIAQYLSQVARRQNIELLLIPTQESAEEATAGFGPPGAQENATEGLKRIAAGEVPTPEQTDGLEAIILPKIRPVLDVVEGDFHTEHPLWLKLNDDRDVRGRLQKAIRSVGRIELPGNSRYPYGGTGFVVGEGLVVTNRHVAAIFSSGVGLNKIDFKPGLRAGLDLKRELDRTTGPTLTVKRVVMVHPYWDMALLAVEGLPIEAEPLKLSLTDVPLETMIEVAAIGYPAYDRRNDADVQNDLFRRVFGVKRLQPGTLGGRQQTESFGKMVAAFRHNCSTLGGNSGSALVDLATGEVVGLHFGGKYSVINYAVPTCELARDQKVVDAGVRFSDKPPGATPPWESWWKQAVEAPDLRAPEDKDTAQPRQKSPYASMAQTTMRVPQTGAIEITIPLRITIQLGESVAVPAAAPSPAPAQPGENVEAMVMPWHDDDYGSRKGYNPRFLETLIPMPEPNDPDVVAKAADGSAVLHYEHFSIIMHAERRLALITASNVTAEKRLKAPETGYEYSRKGLSGLDKSDQERWFPDPRLDEKYQLPDVFYTNDKGAFDKGHIVRREDVAWGETYVELRRANGDTFHVTNCSPQVAEFNRSTSGEDNWGDLENHVLTSAAKEQYCQFAGPILDPDDHFFIGAGGGRVELRIKIPQRFWKVIVARTAEGLASYGFVLEQDLGAVPLEEFVVPDEFQRFMEPLKDIQERAGIRFPKVIVDADQHETDEGIELAFRAGVKRRSKAEGIADQELIVTEDRIRRGYG